MQKRRRNYREKYGMIISWNGKVQMMYFDFALPHHYDIIDKV